MKRNLYCLQVYTVLSYGHTTVQSLYLRTRVTLPHKAQILTYPCNPDTELQLLNYVVLLKRLPNLTPDSNNLPTKFT